MIDRGSVAVLCVTCLVFAAPLFVASAGALAVPSHGGMDSDAAAFQSDRTVSFTTSNATDGSTYEYELSDFAAVTDFTIEVTGAVSTETDTDTGSLNSPGARNITVAGNAEPTAGRLTITGNSVSRRSGYVNGTNNFLTLYGDHGVNTEHGHGNPPTTIDKIRVYQATSAGSGGVVDVYIVEERPDGEYGEGTKVKDNWEIPAGTGYQTIDIDDYTVGSSNQVTIEFLTVTASSQSGSTKTRGTFQNSGGRFSQGGNVVNAVGDFVLVGAAPGDVSASSQTVSNTSFGSFSSGESKTKSFPVSTSDSSIALSWDGSGSLRWSLEYTERTVSENVTVEVNGHTTRHSGTLANGSTASLTTDADWIRPGTNRVTVSVGNATTADAPPPRIGLTYRHDVRLAPTPTATPEPTPTPPPDPDDDDDSGSGGGGGGGGSSSSGGGGSGSSSSSSGGGGGSGSSGGGGGGAGSLNTVAPATDTPTSTATPTPATTDAAATPAQFDDTTVVDVSFEKRNIRPSENAVVLVTVRNPQQTADTHRIELELFDQVVNTREVTVPAQGETTVEFVHNIVEPGTYTARVDSETATVRVLASDETASQASTARTTSTTFPGFGVVTGLVALVSSLVAVHLVRRDYV